MGAKKQETGVPRCRRRHAMTAENTFTQTNSYRLSNGRKVKFETKGCRRCRKHRQRQRAKGLSVVDMRTKKKRRK